MSTHLLQLELNRLWTEFHRSEVLLSDPLGNVSSALSADDFELVSFISAGLSYGRVEHIKSSLNILWKNLSQVGLAPDGSGISRWLVDNSGKTLQREASRALKDWVHRFNRGDDIVALLLTLKGARTHYSSLADLYAKSRAENPAQRLNDFSLELRSFSTRDQRDRVRWFTCAPSEGSTCKRMVMWLRWMLRSDDIDPGLWSQRKVKYSAEVTLTPALAFIPLDTHVFRWALARKITTRKSPSWKTVEEVTQVLRAIDASDPARFDFCICHAGMAGARRNDSHAAGGALKLKAQ